MIQVSFHLSSWKIIARRHYSRGWARADSLNSRIFCDRGVLVRGDRSDNWDGLSFDDGNL